MAAEQAILGSLDAGAPVLRVPASIVLERDLIASDLTIEGALLTLRDSPGRVFEVLGFQARTETLPFDPRALRYHHDAIAAIAERIKAGDKPIFESALPASWRDGILAHLGLAGSGVDKRSSEPEHDPAATPHVIKSWAKALRLHQWSKNALIFVPIMMAHRLFDLAALFNTILAFVCFGLVASAIYLMNDLMDLKQDRRHPTKYRRPFASGAIAARYGLFMLPVLLGTAAIIAATLPPLFALTMTAYLMLNLGYTFYLKRKLLVDVIALSGAYTLRILAGNAAGPIEVSNWLLAFSMFIFFSLALVKRYVELDTVETHCEDEKRVMGRGYRLSDLDMLSQLGVASGFAAVVVLALFIEGAGKSGLYSHREVIWLVCPIVLYVISRIWVLAKRRELPDDPIYFILTDWRSHLMGAIVALTFFFAI